jgi:hypothetical protein
VRGSAWTSTTRKPTARLLLKKEKWPGRGGSNSAADLGSSLCATADLEAGVEKTALYAVGEKPSHAARQLASGIWTSKLGPNIDIEHTTLEALAGGVYGELAAVLSRKATT